MLRIPMKDHLRNSPQPTDVTFVFQVFQGEDTEPQKHVHDVVFPAHRESRYFEKWLTGDWQHMDEVSIEDCQPGAFRTLLRWIYCDKAVDESIHPSTFVAILLAAERFGIHDLVSRLIFRAQQLLTMDLFREILDVLAHRQIACANELDNECPVLIDKLLTVDRFYEIIDMVEDRQIGCVNELTERCLKYFDTNAAALTKRASFLSIRQGTLTKILARDSIPLREIDIYRAASRWARAQLKGADKRPTHRAIREVLGDALFLIRFPTMHPQEFTSGPSKHKILLVEEERAIYRRFHSAGPASCAFSAVPRIGMSRLPLRHFKPTYCLLCGKRLDGDDTCPECGCCYRSTVKCDACDMRFQVGHDAFDWSWQSWHKQHNEEDCGVAYLCSCGAPNMVDVDDFGPSDGCTRCGKKVWHCASNDLMSRWPCDCVSCKEYDHSGF